MLKKLNLLATQTIDLNILFQNRYRTLVLSLDNLFIYSYQF